jgi:uncharacterized membrane protein YjdF
MTATTLQPDRATLIHRWIVRAVTAVMTLDAVILATQGLWMSAVLVVVILLVILAPTLLRERLPVKIPAEFLVAALLFSFAALFLGEVRDYYRRVWWWDIALHGTSGLLLGILGFLLVYVLNESRQVSLSMRPRFVALFAFLFALSIGTLWEVFEFAMDQLVGTTMQKPMLGDPSGLTDTMWDLIVDALGAATVSILGWWYMSRGTQSFFEPWIAKFIQSNPKLFRSDPGG